MKGKTIITLFAVMLLAGSLIAGGESNKKDGRENDPSCIQDLHHGRILNVAGTVTCDPMPVDPGLWIPLPSGDWKIRELTFDCTATFPKEPQFSHTSRVVTNCNMNEDWAGSCWGTVSARPGDTNPAFEGVFEAKLDYSQLISTGGPAFGMVETTGWGSGGDLQDLKYEGVEIYPESGGPATVHAKIFDPQSWRN